MGAGAQVYGVWGDTNGGKSTGEASISLATACFGNGMTGDNGYSSHDVLYLAFTGNAAKPGKDGANWCVWSHMAASLGRDSCSWSVQGGERL